MKPPLSKLSWISPQSTEEAIQAQKEMAENVLLQDVLPEKIKRVGGVDVSNTPRDPRQMIFAAVVILSYPSLAVQATAVQANRQEFPYIPGLLGFREAPSLVQAYQQLSKPPDLILVDGHGISHPRGLGIASHLGVLLDVPTIGVAKSILVGRPEGALGEEMGSTVPLKWRGKQIGICLRTKKRCSPLIVSPGHKISPATALKWVLQFLRGYRLPEPIRQAHQAANAYRIQFLNSLGDN
jgi:deoxyribonuclease V